MTINPVDPSTTIVLVATITKGTESDTREFTVNILKEAPQYTVNYSAGENGAITSVKAGETDVKTGDKVVADTKLTVTVAPAEGFRLASVTIGEGAADTSVAGKTSFELTITADTTFAVAFAEIPANTTVTAKYTGTTSKMTGKNDAAKLGLDDTIFTAKSEKLNGYNNFAGLNEDGSIRLYQSGSNSGCNLTISVAEGYEIVSIKVTTGAGKKNGVLGVTDGTTSITATDGVYAINGKTVVFSNTNTANSQVWITSIEITYKAVA